MATAEFAGQEARRKKWIGGLAIGGLGATVITVGLAYWWNRMRQGNPPPAPQALPTNIQKQASGYLFTQSIGVRQTFTIHAARTVAFKQGGITVLEDVMVEVFGRQGNRHDVLRTRQCEYNPQSGDLSSPGPVEIELSAAASGMHGPSRLVPQGARSGPNRLFLETSQVTFRQKGSLVVTNQLVRFRFGPGTGSARGLRYAPQQGWLELEKDVKLEVHPGGQNVSTSPAAGLAGWVSDPPPSRPAQEVAPGGSLGSRVAGRPPMPGPIRLTAGHLRYDSPRGGRGSLRLAGPLQITQANRRILCQRGTVSLDGSNRVTQVVLEGDVQAFDSSEEGEIQSKTQRVRGDFDPASGRLRTAVAEGGVMAESRRRHGSVGRLEAQRFEMTFEGIHPQPQSGIASGSVRLTSESFNVPAPGSLPRAAGDKMSGEKKTLSTSQVHFVFRPDGKSLSEIQTAGEGKLTLVPAAPNLGEREITAGQFFMTLDTRSRVETLRGLSQTRIVFRPPRDAPPQTSSQTASSERFEATFDPATQTVQQMDQVGSFKFEEGDRQARAERATYLATTQDFTLTGHPEVWDTNTRIGAERILINLRSNSAEGVGQVQSTVFGSPGGSDDATHILADRALAQRRSEFVHYEGHVRAWHGTDVVESSSIDVSRTQRRVSSGSGVLTSHFQPALPSEGVQTLSIRQARGGGTLPVTIRADRLDYFDEGNKASYRGDVELRTENTALRADRLDVYFSKARVGGASEIERAVADGHVTVTQPARRASAEHAEYEAASGKIQLTGGPPTLYDAEKGSTTGQRLTFFAHDDSLIVDGDDQFPTLSKHRVAQ